MYSIRYYRDSVNYMGRDAAGDMKMTGTRWLLIQCYILGQTWYFNLRVLELLISFIFLYVSTILLLIRISADPSCLFFPSFLYISDRFFNTALSTVRHFHHCTSFSGSSEVRITQNGFRIVSVSVSGSLTVRFCLIVN